ncbi:MAG: hypothetical protein INQ03_15425 [Candidatus Heimdallarchaeota archaeon]|nr:hypothetical protein [Candidatus Heimdallarchaeota archaeon]
MKKPRCPTCEYAMKRVYHRNGAKGVTETISSWWYCATCNTMELEPYQIEENPEEYLHPDAAEKFPKVAAALEFNADMYRLRHDLDRLNNMPRELFEDNPYQKAQIERIRRLKIYDRYPRSIAIYICKECEYLEEISFLGDDEPVTPEHCGQAMKIGVSNIAELRRNHRQRKMNQLLMQDIDDSFGFEFLDLILDLIIKYHPNRGNEEFVDLKSLLPLDDSAFGSSWIYQWLQSLFNIFRMDRSPAFNKGLIYYLSHAHDILRFRDYMIAEINAVITDLMQFLSQVHLDKIPMYRMKMQEFLIMYRMELEFNQTLRAEASGMPKV